MVFIYLAGFYLNTYIISNFFNITNFLTTVFDINYSSLVVIFWLVLVITQILTTKKSSSWVTDLVLYTFGVYRTLLSNFISSVFVLTKNINTFFSFIKYNIQGIFGFLNLQVWTPLYRRGAYLLLLNSSRTRWQLSKSNSIFKNK